MGGSLSVTVKYPNGKIEKMCRWTNPLSNFITNIHFINSEETHLNEYMKLWYEMKSDYSKNKKTKNFEFPMTECYAPYRNLAPIGYGLIVIDYFDKIVYNMNSYSSLNILSASTVFLRIVDKFNRTKEDIENWKELVNSKRIFLFDVRNKNKKIKDILDYDELVDYVAKNAIFSYNHMFKYFRIDVSPWKIKNFKSDEKNKMKKTLLNAGYKFTKTDEKLWKEF